MLQRVRLAESIKVRQVDSGTGYALTSRVWSQLSVCSGGTVFFLLGGSLHGRGMSSAPPHQVEGAPSGGVSVPFLVMVLQTDPSTFPGERERARKDDVGRSSPRTSEAEGGGGRAGAEVTRLRASPETVVSLG